MTSSKLQNKIDRLYQTVNNLYTTSDYDQAVAIAIQIQDLVKQLPGDNLPDSVSILSTLGTLFEAKKEIARAEEYYRQALAAGLQIYAADDLELASLLESLAFVCYDGQKYPDAVELFTQAAEIRRKSYGAHHLDYAASLANLATVYKAMPNYEAAESLFLQILEIQREALGEDHLDLTLTLNNLASLYRVMGKPEAAVPIYQQALEIRRKDLGDDHPDIAASLNLLGVLYKTMGDYTSAEPFYKQALEIRRKVLNPEHPDLILSLSNLASLFLLTRNIEAGVPLFHELIEIERCVFGEKDARVIDDLDRLALLYQVGRDYTHAEPLYLEVLEARQTAPGQIDSSALIFTITNLVKLYLATTNYSAARSWLEHLLSLKRQVLGDDHPEIADILNQLIDLTEKMGDEQSADLFRKQAQEIEQTTQRPSQQETIAEWKTKARMLYRFGKYEAAIMMLEQLVRVTGEVYGKDHLECASAMSDLAGVYLAIPNYAAAEQYYQQALDIQLHRLGPDHLEIAATLHNIGWLAFSRSDYAAARQNYQEVVRIRRLVLGREDLKLGSSLSNLAKVNLRMHEIATAESLYKEAISIYKAKSQLSEDYAIILCDLAETLQAAGKKSEAEPRLHEAIEILRELNNPFTLASALHSLGWSMFERGDYIAAEPLLREALDHYRQTVGEGDSNYGNVINDLAMLSYKMGNYARAETYFQKAIEIGRSVYGEMHPNTISAMNNLAAVYYATGNYGAAEPMYRQLLAVEKDPDNRAFTLNNLGVLYHAMGNTTEAENLCQQSLTLRRSIFRPDHPEIGTTLANLANIKVTKGDYSAALSLYREALAILSAGDGSHPDLATLLNNAAQAFRNGGQLSIAAALLEEALQRLYEQAGAAHPNTARTMMNLATVYQDLGDYTRAEPLYKQSLLIYTATLGSNHPELAECLTGLATLFIAQQRLEEAERFMQEAQSIDNQMIGQIFAIGSESIRMAYMSSMAARLAIFFSSVMESPEGKVERIITRFNQVLRRKGLGAEALVLQRDAVLRGRYPALEKNLQELRQLQHQIAVKTLEGPVSESIEQHEETLDIWRRRKETVEAELASQIPEMNLTLRLRDLDYQVIAQLIPPGAVLAEIVRFDAYDFRATPRRWISPIYMAFVICAADPERVHMVRLGEADRIEGLLRKYLGSITGEDQTDAQQTTVNHPPSLATESIRSEVLSATRHLGSSKKKISKIDLEAGRALRALIFDPILSAVNDCNHVFLAPDGELTRLPFECLPLDEKDAYLVDKYSISYLTVGRDVLRLSSQSKYIPTAPLIIADPDYDLDNSSTTIETPFQRLSGTIQEGKFVANLFNGEPLVGKRALKRALREIRSPRILHLSTHGFFLPNIVSEPSVMPTILRPSTNISKTGLDRLTGQRLVNPMLRSGLALAGANTWLQGNKPDEAAENGLLFAEDVIGLDLLDTEMVVLSACDTGLGDVLAGEGVYGLRRAFLIAGAKTLVMSLWKVPDTQTKELMVSFYQNIAAGVPRAWALRKAQLALKDKHANPFFWGAFICQGDPSLLPMLSPGGIS